MSEQIRKGNRMKTMVEGSVFKLRDGWHCIVDGYQFGPWPDKGSATAGMQTEQRRAELWRRDQPLQDAINDHIIARKP